MGSNLQNQKQMWPRNIPFLIECLMWRNTFRLPVGHGPVLTAKKLRNLRLSAHSPVTSVPVMISMLITRCFKKSYGLPQKTNDICIPGGSNHCKNYGICIPGSSNHCKNYGICFPGGSNHCKNNLFASLEAQIIIKTMVFASLEAQIIIKTTVFASLEAQIIIKTTVFASLEVQIIIKNKRYLHPWRFKSL